VLFIAFMTIFEKDHIVVLETKIGVSHVKKNSVIVGFFIEKKTRCFQNGDLSSYINILRLNVYNVKFKNTK